ncbi:MFS transporter [Alicyclobacillus sp. ALC3]|uniref:MFS transporter n=1 Tax=Alicyclobacillus sp. ALC3 TaxID=2796143 RepID=UPI002379789B|nr:MFS transporter [Alicyclobacillus sp. ALC3]WDL97639.1 MFS transporter [Alicyclobacillus sp. ALC3]
MELTARQKWWVLITAGLATFLPSTYNSILNTILPEIQHGLHSSLAASAWIMLMYLLVLTVLLLPVGRVSDLIGRRNLLVAGFLLFAGAAVFCAVSRDLVWVVVGRGIMGVGGAMLISVAPAVVTTVMPARERGRAMGFLGLLTYLGMAVGPVLGGTLTQLWGWPAVFLFAVPTGLVGVLLGIIVIPKSPKASGRVPLDTRGTLVYAVAAVAFTLAMNPSVLGRDKTVAIAVLVAVTVASIVGFILIERRQAKPLMCLNLFTIRTFSFGIIATVLNYSTFFIVTFLVPVYLSHQFRFSPAVVGLWMSGMSVVMAVVAPAAGAMYDRIGSRALSTVGMACGAVSLAVFTLVARQGNGEFLWLAVALLLNGFGTAVFAPPNNTSVLMSAPSKQQGMASGVLTTSRYFGMMCGIALGSTLFNAIIHSLPGSTASGYDDAFRGVMWTAAGIMAIGTVIAYGTRSERKDAASVTSSSRGG